MTLVAVKAVVFLMIHCNAPSGGTCSIGMYVPDTGFVAIKATPARSELGDSFTASYTLNGKSYSLSMGEPDKEERSLRSSTDQARRKDLRLSGNKPELPPG